MEIKDLVKTVELAIVDMGLSKEESQADEQGQWILLKNETPIYIDAWDDKQSTPWNYFIFEQDKTVFQITGSFQLAFEHFAGRWLLLFQNLHHGE